MAFATTNVQAANIAGPVKVYCGDWSGLPGDADGTITMGGGRVYMAHFENQDADSPREFPLCDVSVSGSTITVTVHNHQNVTNGRFVIIYS